MDSDMDTTDQTNDIEAAFSAPDFDPRKHRDFFDEGRERLTREAQVASFRPDWRPMADLPVPSKTPGYAYRYVRVADHNVSDTRNVSRKLAEGWVPVSKEEQPEIVKMLGRLGVNSDGNIEIGGLMLCKMPLEVQKARARYYNQVARDQLQAVDNSYMREQDRRMPKLAPDRRTTISGSPLG